MARTLNATAIVRERLRRVATGRLEPLIAAIVRQGTSEGSFRMIDEPSMRFWFA